MFDITNSSLVSFEEFQLLYFEIFNRIQMSTGGTIDFHNLALNEDGAQLSSRHMKANENGTFLQTEHSNTVYEDTLLVDENSNNFSSKNPNSNSHRHGKGLQDLKNIRRKSNRHSLASLKNLQELWKSNGSTND